MALTKKQKTALAIGAGIVVVAGVAYWLSQPPIPPTPSACQGYESYLSDGSVIKTGAVGEAPYELYKMEAGKKRWIPTMEVFVASGFRLEDIKVLPQSCVDAIVFADGSLIKGDASDAVYLMEAGKKRWIVSIDVFISCGFTWDAILKLPQACVDAIPSGENVTSGHILNVGSYDVGYRSGSYVNIELNQKTNKFVDPAGSLGEPGLFHFEVPQPWQPGQVIGVWINRPWAGVTGDGLYRLALTKPLLWSGTGIPEIDGSILIPIELKPIFDEFGLTAILNMVAGDATYNAIMAKYGGLLRSFGANLLVIALAIKDAMARGLSLRFMTLDDIHKWANIVDEKFLVDWLDPKWIVTRAGQMHLSVSDYIFVALAYFRLLHGYIPTIYAQTWNDLFKDPTQRTKYQTEYRNGFFRTEQGRMLKQTMDTAFANARVAEIIRRYG
jgi:hypothetical protein